MREPHISNGEALDLKIWILFLGQWISEEWISEKFQEQGFDSKGNAIAEPQAVPQSASEVEPIVVEIRPATKKSVLLREAV